ncbi:MAG: hypothetical protein H6822_21780 [Planctomycetaceae bacterium]|nr:hypothetical protein [Planctomycetales bacterium]MCB9924827.1 hypothetical protein [Planctomycetaceae bacterium]
MKVRLTLWSLFSVAAITAMGCASDIRSHNLPPAERLMQPGPGVGGPGPGVIPPAMPSAVSPVSYTSGVPMQHQTIQMLFSRPESMQVQWDVTGVGQFDSEPLIVPGRKNFPEGGIYRLKVTNIGGREGVELYPTLEVGPTTPRTAAYLAHNAIPVQLTEEDFDQVLSGNFVTKVIYLPDPEFQEMALAGVETLVSTRLDPGIDPIVEADRRGSIMAVIRLGNKDVEMPGAMGDQVMAASFMEQMQGGVPMGAMPMAASSLGPGGLTPPYVSGVTVPQYGMTTSGTPIGLPGPPHIPFGGPASLQSHSIRNNTHMHLPGGVEQFKIHVKETPGYSYPRPPSHMSIHEQHIHPSLPYGQPHSNRTQVIPMNETGYMSGHLGSGL